MRVVFSLIISVCEQQERLTMKYKSQWNHIKHSNASVCFCERSVPGANVVGLTIMDLCFRAIQRYLSIPHFLYLYLQLSNLSLSLSCLPHVYTLFASSLSSCSFLSPLHLTHSSLFSSLLPWILPLLTFPPLIFPFFPSCFLPIIIFLLFYILSSRHLYSARLLSLSSTPFISHLFSHLLSCPLNSPMYFCSPPHPIVSLRLVFNVFPLSPSLLSEWGRSLRIRPYWAGTLFAPWCTTPWRSGVTSHHLTSTRWQEVMRIFKSTSLRPTTMTGIPLMGRAAPWRTRFSPARGSRLGIRTLMMTRPGPSDHQVTNVAICYIKSLDSIQLWLYSLKDNFARQYLICKRWWLGQAAK